MRKDLKILFHCLTRAVQLLNLFLSYICHATSVLISQKLGCMRKAIAEIIGLQQLFVNKINFELQSGHTKHKHLTRFFFVQCKSAINTLIRMKSLHFVIAQKMCKTNIKCCCFGCAHCNQESLFVVAMIWDLC